MDEAYQLDCDANVRKVGSTEKIKKLPIIEQKLRSAVLSKKFLEENGQRILASWLSRLPDKTESNISFRTRLFNLLLDLKIPHYDTISRIHGNIKQIYQQGKKFKYYRKIELLNWFSRTNRKR